MRSTKNFLLSILTVSSFLSCTKPFETDSFAFTRVLVVDGTITDEIKFHTVNLSYTYPIGEANQEAFLTNAQLWIESGDGERIDYNEIEPGLYQSEFAFAGEPNQTYQVYFTTSEGKNYTSFNQTLIPSPPIDSIYDRYATIINEELNAIIPGVQFFIDSHDESNNAKYFRYEWKEDYKISTPSNSYWVYELDTDTLLLREEPVNTCYESSESTNIIIGNSLGSSTNRVAEQPVNFVSSFTDKYRVRYALQVKQYAISESAFGFYRKLKESNESSGSLFDIQQGTIAGNIRSLDDPTETVLGYFEVSGVSDSRTFFNYSDLEEEVPRPSFRFSCDFNAIQQICRDSLFYYVGENTRVIDMVIVDDSFESGIYSYTSRNCADCSWYATTEPPEYWVD